MASRAQQLQHFVNSIGNNQAVALAAQSVRLMCVPTAVHALEPSITDPVRTDKTCVAEAVRVGALEALLAALQRSVPRTSEDGFSASWIQSLTIRKEVCRTLVVLTNATPRGAHHAVCARAVAAGAVPILLEALRKHCRGPEISGDVMRVLAQLLQSQRGAATSAQVAQAREHAQSLLGEHYGDGSVDSCNPFFGHNVRVQADALLAALALPADVLAPDTPTCLLCGAAAADGEVLKRCGRCRQARYCCQTCQRSDWAEHKRECRAAPQE